MEVSRGAATASSRGREPPVRILHNTKPRRGNRNHCSDRASVAPPGLRSLIAWQPGAARFALAPPFHGIEPGYLLWPLRGRISIISQLLSERIVPSRVAPDSLSAGRGSQRLYLRDRERKILAAEDSPRAFTPAGPVRSCQSLPRRAPAGGASPPVPRSAQPGWLRPERRSWSGAAEPR